MKKTGVPIFLLLFLFACQKDHIGVPLQPQVPPNQQGLPVANGLPVTLTIDETRPGNAISPNFEGLSYETGILAESPEILNVNNKVLVQLIKNLGPGLLRIGGDSSDETFWTGSSRTSGTGKDSITTTDIDRLAAFSNAIGWPVLFGLNAGSSSIPIATNEALYVSNALTGNLYALQAGNEPDVYHLFGLRSANYSVTDYQTEFETYKAAIQSQVPNVSFAGPGTAYDTNFLTTFAENENSNIKLYDAHYYVTGPASSPGINYQTILSPDWKLSYLLSDIGTETSKFNLPFRITECNSVYGGGKAGVSDVFASALWALDFMWTVASNNGLGINFHGGNGLIYSPVSIENGVITAKPEYYAMLTFKYGSAAASLVPVTSKGTTYNCSAYACSKADNSTSVTLINKELSNNLSFTINLKSAHTAVSLSQLIAPLVTSTTGTTFGGNTVNTDGTFATSPQQYTVSGKSFIINVPASSAMVVGIK